MKKLFWILLLLVNVIFFAVMQWGEVWWGKPVLQEQPALHEEMIRLVDTPQSGALGAVTIPAAASSATQLASGSKDQICLEWGEFSGAELARATAALSALQLGDKLSQHQYEHNIGYWVYIPPLNNRAEVNQKVAQLKALGVGEYFIVQESGLWRNAISLGIFKTQEAAQHFLDDLNGKGVRSARVGERLSKLKSTKFSLNGVSAETEAQLTAMQKDFAESELKNVPCTLTR